ncbi:MAG TPA: DUF1653 domain-containing protein [Cytophagaceae bacterium]|jgi:hypothetical protein|nr:DUF1653 domain-containing protein [Cytophagaceae bacterium]
MYKFSNFTDMQTGRYLHYKGNYYVVLGTVIHSETEEELVLYRSEKNDQLWVRSRNMFEESVFIGDREVKRFQWIEKLDV